MTNVTSGREIGYVSERALEIANELETELCKLPERYGLIAASVQAVTGMSNSNHFSVTVIAQKDYPRDAAQIIVETVCQSIEDKYKDRFGFLVKVVNGRKVIDTDVSTLSV